MHGEFGQGDRVRALVVSVAQEEVLDTGTGHDGQGDLDGHVVTDPRPVRRHVVDRAHGGENRLSSLRLNRCQSGLL
ncbi:hypothetical protein [Streptomyces sp. NPDC093568]|uniref:hypothetical protein n=1 Tax=Streptomyces sp. NPDC093568 TaxID=3366041 RepID=UPI0037F237E7